MSGIFKKCQCLGQEPGSHVAPYAATGGIAGGPDLNSCNDSLNSSAVGNSSNLIASTNKAGQAPNSSNSTSTSKSSAVTKVELQHQGLEDLPSYYVNYDKTLEELHLEMNYLTEVPKLISFFGRLTYLNLCENEIGTLTSELGELANLIELDVSKNNVSLIDDALKKCQYLSVLNLSVNPVKVIPACITQLLNLTQLYLNETHLDELPECFGNLSKLKILELRENNLTTLPKSVCLMSILERLDIGNNEFSELPDVIGTLFNLKELWCDMNELTSLPSFIGCLKSLDCLDASKNKINYITSDIKGCTLLSDCHLSFNHLKEVPESIGHLCHLTLLKIDSNQLTKLPDQLAGDGRCEALKELFLNNNCMSRIPAWIGNLKHLHTFNVDDNLIEELPPELGDCTSLAILSCRNNRLTVLPDEIGKLDRLKVCNLCDNKLTRLPITILNLNQITALWLSKNQSNPLVPMQIEHDLLTKRQTLTCVLLPQRETDEETSMSSSNDDKRKDEGVPTKSSDSNTSEVTFQEKNNTGFSKYFTSTLTGRNKSPSSSKQVPNLKTSQPGRLKPILTFSEKFDKEDLKNAATLGTSAERHMGTGREETNDTISSGSAVHSTNEFHQLPVSKAQITSASIKSIEPVSMPRVTHTLPSKATLLSEPMQQQTNICSLTSECQTDKVTNTTCSEKVVYKCSSQYPKMSQNLSAYNMSSLPSSHNTSRAPPNCQTVFPMPITCKAVPFTKSSALISNAFPATITQQGNNQTFTETPATVIVATGTGIVTTTAYNLSNSSGYSSDGEISKLLFNGATNSSGLNNIVGHNYIYGMPEGSRTIGKATFIEDCAICRLQGTANHPRRRLSRSGSALPILRNSMTINEFATYKNNNNTNPTNRCSNYTLNHLIGTGESHNFSGPIKDVCCNSSSCQNSKTIDNGILPLNQTYIIPTPTAKCENNCVISSESSRPFHEARAAIGLDENKSFLIEKFLGSRGDLTENVRGKNLHHFPPTRHSFCKHVDEQPRGNLSDTSVPVLESIANSSYTNTYHRQYQGRVPLGVRSSQHSNHQQSSSNQIFCCECHQSGRFDLGVDFQLGGFHRGYHSDNERARQYGTPHETTTAELTNVSDNCAIGNCSKHYCNYKLSHRQMLGIHPRCQCCPNLEDELHNPVFPPRNKLSHRSHKASKDCMCDIPTDIPPNYYPQNLSSSVCNQQYELRCHKTSQCNNATMAQPKSNRSLNQHVREDHGLTSPTNYGLGIRNMLVDDDCGHCTPVRKVISSSSSYHLRSYSGAPQCVGSDINGHDCNFVRGANSSMCRTQCSCSPNITIANSNGVSHNFSHDSADRTLTVARESLRLSSANQTPTTLIAKKDKKGGMVITQFEAPKNPTALDSSHNAGNVNKTPPSVVLTSATNVEGTPENRTQAKTKVKRGFLKDKFALLKTSGRKDAEKVKFAKNKISSSSNVVASCNSNNYSNSINISDAEHGNECEWTPLTKLTSTLMIDSKNSNLHQNMKNPITFRDSGNNISYDLKSNDGKNCSRKNFKDTLNVTMVKRNGELGFSVLGGMDSENGAKKVTETAVTNCKQCREEKRRKSPGPSKLSKETLVKERIVESLHKGIPLGNHEHLLEELESQEKLFLGNQEIFVNKILKNGPADGILKAGDLIISVNEIKFAGLSHEEAVQVLKTTPSTVRMTIQRKL